MGPRRRRRDAGRAWGPRGRSRGIAPSPTPPPRYAWRVTLDLERLAAALPELDAGELAGLHRAWERRGPDEPSDFVSWLHARGALADATLLRLARSARAPVQVTDSGHLAPDQGLRVVGEVGRGAMGEVLLARDERLGRTVALKRLDARYVDDPGLVHRFLVEAQLTAQLDHPGIVPVHGIRTDAGEPPAYSMKLVRGRTLKAFMTEAREAVEQGKVVPRALRLPARLELFCQICEPLAYAHARGVLHRDLKPDNIMVGAFGAVFVMDWGVARVRVGAEGAAGAVVATAGGTLAGDVVGTPAYMSPEQARGENATLTPASDQFALGVILHELVSLRRARASIRGGAVPMVMAAARGHVDPLQPLAEPLGRELRAVICKATARDPARRYADVGAFAEDVRRVIRGEAVEALPDSPLQRLGRLVVRHRERVAVGIVGVGLLALAAVGLTVAGALGVRELDREAAAAREARKLAIGELVSTRARGLDLAFLHHEGRLRGLAAAAERALQGSATGPVYLAADFKDAERAPPDLAHSAAYRGPASFDHPDIPVAPGFDLVAGAARLGALASLRPELADVLLGSVDAPPADPGASRSLVLTHGTPVVWAYVATADGAMVAFPGTGNYPPEYDPRTTPWYTAGILRASPGWSRPYLDESGMGLLIGCGLALRDAAGHPAGVVGLDVGVPALVEDWITPGDLDAEGFLVGDDGAVLVRSRGGNTPTAEPAPFPWPDVLEVVRGTPGGQARVGDQFAAWSRLGAVDWTYVVVGPLAIAEGPRDTTPG